MNEDKRNALFAAHHSDETFLKQNCNHYFHENLSIAESLAEEPHVSEPFRHSHDAYEFLIPYGPIPMIMYMDAVYIGEVGYVYPMRSQAVHASRFRITGISHDDIVIDKDYWDKLQNTTIYAGKEFSGNGSLSQELNSFIQLFKMVYLERTRDDIKMKKLENLTELISLELMDCIFREEPKRSKEHWQYQKGMLSVVSYMNQHYREQQDIQELAHMAGLSKNYFIASFKKFTGSPPLLYLTKLRISYAQTLLEGDDLSMAEIARECGYRKSNTFSAVFKKETGMSPSEYRRSSKRY